MKIGPESRRQSAISTSTPDQITVRGLDLCSDLIGRISFTDHAWLLVTGQLPSRAQAAALDACLVAIAEHGLVPSVQAARMTYAAAPEALQGAVAAGLLGCGSVILGAAEDAARFLSGIAAGDDDIEGRARAAITRLRAEKRPIPGYGHPLHKAEDPRTTRLRAVAADTGQQGRHWQAADTVARLIPEITGKTLTLNVSGAIPALMLDAGYPMLAMKGVPLLARTASLIAHLLEERQSPIGFALSEAGAAAIGYDGPAVERAAE
ncbi:MAG: citryl-CoA lyase [Rhodobacteraceae bacterium]|jgi:citrate synthase|nr:citryl-CoA lyase [Paracoccaceae bacterium]